mmetsp:Transcript_108730/g.307538  ORF Transcript_108730/g.307538 Transcript_108730/m.307538 type:complete len:351 (+) Transcript_108730:3-1055(+)
MIVFGEGPGVEPAPPSNSRGRPSEVAGRRGAAVPRGGVDPPEVREAAAQPRARGPARELPPEAALVLQELPRGRRAGPPEGGVEVHALPPLAREGEEALQGEPAAADAGRVLPRPRPVEEGPGELGHGLGREGLPQRRGGAPQREDGRRRRAVAVDRRVFPVQPARARRQGPEPGGDVLAPNDADGGALGDQVLGRRRLDAAEGAHEDEGEARRQGLRGREAARLRHADVRHRHELGHVRREPEQVEVLREDPARRLQEGLPQPRVLPARHGDDGVLPVHLGVRQQPQPDIHAFPRALRCRQRQDRAPIRVRGGDAIQLSTLREGCYGLLPLERLELVTDRDARHRNSTL